MTSATSTTGTDSRPLPLFIELELLAGTLYGIFAEKYPEHREFWEAISDEEQHHADILRVLGEKMESGEVLFVEGKSRTSALKTFIDYLKQTIAKSRKEDFPMAKALSIALDIEKSVLEKNALDHFHGDSPEVADTLEKLKSETVDHARRIEAAWRRIKES